MNKTTRPASEIPPAQSRSLTKAKTIGLWIAQILLALAFLAAGFAKLSAQPGMVETFAKVGGGQWLRPLTGLIEIVSALLLLFPRLASAGAALLVCTMIGAVVAHLTLVGGSPVAPLVLGLLSAVVAWGRFDAVSIPSLQRACSP